jgi:gluconokinase
MGIAGAGKTTIARRLAEAHGSAFLEGDDLHPAASVAKMTAGHPLTDADRRPWLEAVGDWLAAHPGGVASCSALKRAYRDILRDHAPETFIVNLEVPESVAQARVGGRGGHYMPASLVASQVADLEPLDAQEAGVTLDANRAPDAVLREALEAID